MKVYVLSEEDTRPDGNNLVVAAYKQKEDAYEDMRRRWHETVTGYSGNSLANAHLASDMAYVEILNGADCGELTWTIYELEVKE